MLHTAIASIDGFGERDDIALARDISQGIKLDNQKATPSDPDYSWGTELNGAESIVDLVLEMLRRGTPQLLGYKSDIYWPVDIELICHAVNEACIIEGLDEDCYSPAIHCDGHQYEIGLY